MTERVTVTSPRKRAGGAPRGRSPGARPEPGPGAGPVRSLMRAQGRLALVTCAVVALVTGGLPVLFACETGLSRVRVAGVRLPWLVMCVVVPVLWVVIARRHVRLAERAEQEFAEQELAGQELAGHGRIGPGRTGPGPAGGGRAGRCPPGRGRPGSPHPPGRDTPERAGAVRRFTGQGGSETARPE